MMFGEGPGYEDKPTCQTFHCRNGFDENKYA